MSILTGRMRSMALTELLERPAAVILTEGSVYERLRRDSRVEFDPDLAHAALIYDSRSRAILAGIHREYMMIGRSRELPMIVLADNWRATGERIGHSRFAGRDVNGDNIRFVRELTGGDPGIVVAGLMGPRNDAYRPDQAPGYEEALAVHEAQVTALGISGADVIMASTLPSVEEARAMARLLSASGTMWILSFVVRPDGRVLDGTFLHEAIERIDDEVGHPPLGYAVNCVHPDILRRALDAQPSAVDRIVWFQANSSPLSPEELDGLDHLEADPPERFAAALVSVHQDFAIPVVGGCCGTEGAHMTAVAEHLSSAAADQAGRRIS